MTRHRIAAALLGLGLAVAFALTHGAFWPLALAWLGASVALLCIRAVLEPTPSMWLAIIVMVVVALPVLAFEGGVFVLPAALMFLVAEAREPRRPRPARPGA